MIVGTVLRAALGALAGAALGTVGMMALPPLAALGRQTLETRGAALPAPAVAATEKTPTDEPLPDLDPAAAPQGPGFDTVRVEPDGTGLVAGRAEPGSMVSVLAGDEAVAEVAADEEGRFVAFLSLPAFDSPRALSLRDEVGRLSEETVILAPTRLPPAEEAAADAGTASAGLGAPEDLAAPGSPLAPPERGPGSTAAGAGPNPSRESGLPHPDEAEAAQAFPEDAGAAPSEPDRAADPTPEARTDLAETDSTIPASGPQGAIAVETSPQAASAPQPSRPDPGPSSVPPPPAGSTGGPLDPAGPSPAGSPAEPERATAAGPTGVAEPPATLAPAAGTDGPALAAAASGGDVAGVGPGSGAPVAAPLPDRAPGASPPPLVAGTAPALGAPEAPQVRGQAPVLLSDAEGVRLLQPALPSGAAPEVLATVALDAIAYDGAGEVVLSGRGSGGTVRLYLDNEPAGEAAVGEDGQWMASLPDAAPGVYTLRLDQLDAQGEVVSRIETPFQREERASLRSAMADAQGAGQSIAVRVVQPGHTLWAIARDRYGEPLMYVRVFEANRDRIRDPDLIYPGQVFVLPETEAR